MRRVFLDKIRQRLAGLSFRTGIIAVVACVVCYMASFGQMLLPISTAAKGLLWVVFFGLAKTLQYTAILILGTAGLSRLKNRLRRNAAQANDQD